LSFSFVPFRDLFPPPGDVLSSDLRTNARRLSRWAFTHLHLRGRIPEVWLAAPETAPDGAARAEAQFQPAPGPSDALRHAPGACPFSLSPQ
jgi:hypothetical protein